MTRPKLTFGLYALEAERNLGSLLNEFCEWLGEELDAEIACDETPDYETLAQRVRSRDIDIAWLPPIVFLRSGDDAVPVIAIERAARAGFETALIVREDSKLQTVKDLKDSRAAWVDAWSAAGYVIPRLRLRLDGVDVSSLFKEEHFYGTHSAAVRAVIDGEADVAGTYAQTDGKGNVIDGPWKEMKDAKVRALVTFGEIPADVIAAAPSVPENVRKQLALSLSANVGTDPKRKNMVKQLFGADGFGAVNLESYAGLRSALSLASKTENWDDMSKV
jgi:phosphate/phosphite/phosphonate ABC transporter binding protein